MDILYPCEKSDGVIKTLKVDKVMSSSVFNIICSVKEENNLDIKL